MNGFYQRVILTILFLSSEEGFVLLISNVENETPASKNGLNSGDVIVSVNGWAITFMDKVEV